MDSTAWGCAPFIVEWFGVDVHQVRLITGDTDLVPVGGGSHSGRSMRLGGVVMAKASDQVIEKGRRLAAWLLEAAAADIEFSERRFTVRGTDRSVDLFAVAAAALRSDAPDALRGPLAASCDETVSTPSFPYGCAVCEAQVDPDTGVVEIVRYTSVDDVGRAINPMIVHGQTHGGIAQGVGQALWDLEAHLMPVPPHLSSSVNSACSPSLSSPRNASPMTTPSRATIAPPLGEILPGS